MLHCLLDLTPVNENVTIVMVQVRILDGAAIINMLQPGLAKTFRDFATGIFVLYTASQLQHVSRLDIICDVYQYVPESLKADTHNNKGKGIR